MASFTPILKSEQTFQISQAKDEWYAVQTRPRHEKKIAAELLQAGVTTYLPIVKQVHRWSDRRKVVQVPLFSCYTFVKIAALPDSRLQVLRVPGVLGFVGNQGEGIPIPDHEIENVRMLVEQEIEHKEYPFLKAGQRVRIRGGVLDGMEGILVSNQGQNRLVVSLTLIQRSLAVSLEGYDVEKI